MIHRYCSACWSEIEAERSTCPHCGASLDETDKDFVAKLIDAVGHPEPTRAAIAIEILGKRLHEPRAIDALLVRLARRDDDMVITAEVAEALAAIGDRQAVLALGELLADPTRPLVARIAAAEALGVLGGRQARTVLNCAANDTSLRSHRLREAIANAVAEIAEEVDGNETHDVL